MDTLVAGDEAAVETEIRRFADAGATELIMFPGWQARGPGPAVALLADIATRED